MEEDEWSLEPSNFPPTSSQQTDESQPKNSHKKKKKKRDSDESSSSPSSSSSEDEKEQDSSSSDDDSDEEEEGLSRRAKISKRLNKKAPSRKASGAGSTRTKQSVTLVFSAPTKRGSFIIRRDNLISSPSPSTALTTNTSNPLADKSASSKLAASSSKDSDDSSSIQTSTDEQSSSSDSTSESTSDSSSGSSSDGTTSSDDEEAAKKRTRKEVARRRKRSMRRHDPPVPETEEQRRKREAREQRRKEREKKREWQTQQRVQELQDRVRALLEKQERGDNPDATEDATEAPVELIDPAALTFDPTADDKVEGEPPEDPKDFKFVEGEHLRLPLRVLENILVYFRPPELAQFSLVQKAWKKAAESNVIWRTFFRGTKAERYNLYSWKRFYKMCWRRNKIAEEILSTEQTYVQSLQVVVQVFMNPLRDPSNKQIISHTDFKGIFSEIEVILGYNAKLLGELEERMKHWSFDICLGDIFAKISMFLKVYTQYVNHFNKAITIVARLKRTSEDFRAFLMYSQNRKQCKGLELNAFLIMPVQRIPRYVLLLADLVRNTHPLHPDYPALSNARTKMQELAAFINIQKKEAENIYEVIAIQDKLIGKFENIVIPGRTYVFEGVMVEIQLAPNSKGKIQKMTNTMRKKSLTSSSSGGNATISAYKKTDHYAFLFNDMIILAKKTGLTSLVNFSFMAKKAKKKLLSNTQQDGQPKAEETFEFEMQIPLSSDCTVANAPQATVGTETFTQCFQLFTNDRAWLFAVPTDREKAEWMRVLEKVLNDLATSGAKILSQSRSSTASPIPVRGSTPGNGSDESSSVVSPSVSASSDRIDPSSPPAPSSSSSASTGAVAEENKETEATGEPASQPSDSVSVSSELPEPVVSPQNASTPEPAAVLPKEIGSEAAADADKVERNRSKSMMARSSEDVRRLAVNPPPSSTTPNPPPKGMGGRRHSFSVNNIFRKKSSKAKNEQRHASSEDGAHSEGKEDGEHDDKKQKKSRKRSVTKKKDTPGESEERTGEKQEGKDGPKENSISSSDATPPKGDHDDDRDGKKSGGWNGATIEDIKKQREDRAGTWHSRKNSATSPMLSSSDGIGASRFRSASMRAQNREEAQVSSSSSSDSATSSSSGGDVSHAENGNDRTDQEEEEVMNPSSSHALGTLRRNTTAEM